MITRHDANRGGRAGCLASSLITQFLHADFVIGVVVPSGRVQARVTIENRAAAMGDGRAQSPARVRLLRETPAIADLRPSPMPTRSVSVVQIDAEFQLPSVLGIPPSNAAIVPACPGVRGLNGRSTKGTRGAPFSDLLLDYYGASINSIFPSRVRCRTITLPSGSRKTKTSRSRNCASLIASSRVRGRSATDSVERTR